MIFITGNSHLGAIRKGSVDCESLCDLSMFALGSAVFENSEFCQKQGDIVKFLSGDLADRVERSTGENGISSAFTWGFVIGTHNAPLYGDKFWRNTNLCLAEGGGRPVSAAALNHVVMRYLEPKLQFFKFLSQIGCDYFVISGPPPKRGNPCFKKGTDVTEAVFIDRILRSELVSFLTGVGVPFVTPPEDCIDSDGMLLEEYSLVKTSSGKLDPHHANKEYGKMMFEKIQRHIVDNVAKSGDITGIAA